MLRFLFMSLLAGCTVTTVSPQPNGSRPTVSPPHGTRTAVPARRSLGGQEGEPILGGQEGEPVAAEPPAPPPDLSGVNDPDVDDAPPSSEDTADTGMP